ncbi:MAG: transposase, partial [Gemmatimonadales bacterium]
MKRRCWRAYRTGRSCSPSPSGSARTACTGERSLAISRANWHPHIHMIVTDGGFRADGTFVSWPAHEVAPLAEAFRRVVLRL